GISLDVRSGETSNVRCADLRRLSLRASSATLTAVKQRQVGKDAERCYVFRRRIALIMIKLVEQECALEMNG
ncbi:MAG: hypothetical protein IKH57_11790, partial [Clostridia bacterium]|nr:hypothetical protein [Clostridia bacterium]